MANDVYAKKYKFYKFSNIILYVFVVPLLILALFSAIVMINSKNIGGLPSFAGYTVVTCENSNLMGSNPSLKTGEKVLFQKAGEYKVGDYIVYYYSDSTEDKTAKFVSSDGASELSSQINSGLNANAYEQITEDNKAVIKIGKIGAIGEIIEIVGKDNNNKDIEGTRYKAFTVYLQDGGSDAENYVLLESVIGKTVADASPFVVGMLSYCASFDSFLTLIIVPCLFLTILEVMNIFARRAYDKANRNEEKDKIRSEELRREAGIPAGPQRPMRPGVRPGPNRPQPAGANMQAQRPMGATNMQQPARPTPQRVMPQRPMPQRPMGAPQQTMGAPQQPAGAPIRRAPVRPTRPTQPPQ